MQPSKFIDNKRKSLAEVLREIAPQHKHLSIATGYWDLPGTLEIIDEVKGYESIRILIGAEPINSKRLKVENLYKDFPQQDIAADLENLRASDSDEAVKLRETAKELSRLIDKGVLKVKVCRKPFLHAKTFIFGDFKSTNPVGIIGSSNFTKKGLTGIGDGGNAELNTAEYDARIVAFKPTSEEQENGHLSWFEEMWNSEYTEEWSGEFQDIVKNSPMGDETFGPYDAYIKTLMEVFPDELSPKPELGVEIDDILYDYQDRNAGILIHKLEKMGTAILADSVGLGKTITAGAVIKYYLDSGARNVVIIVPSSLKQQWRDDLANVFKLIEGRDYQLISQQDMNAMDSVEEMYRNAHANVDLFVIDEAHNLRNSSSKRYEKVEEWLRHQRSSKVLMLTATPINNSLNDLANQIQLGLKGELSSILVPFRTLDPDGKLAAETQPMDFFDVLKRIQSLSKTNEYFKWDTYKEILQNGIQNYLVRSTRQGVEKEGSLTKNGAAVHFPESKVRNIEYRYADEMAAKVAKIIDDNKEKLESIEVRKIDAVGISKETQRTCHPFDFAADYLKNASESAVIPNIFQLVLLMGFAPYRIETYQHKIYGKTPEEIDKLGLKGEESRALKTQLTIHNMLQVTWVKRLESSTASLLKSAQKYRSRLDAFITYLDKTGYLLSFQDIETVEGEYGDDLEAAFDDYEKYLYESANSDEELKKRGIEKRVADPEKYDVEAIRNDVNRDRNLLEVLEEILTMISNPRNDSKMQSFVEYMEKAISSDKYGQKILVFSFFTDTVRYLEENLPAMSIDKNFKEKSAFLSGQNSKVDNVVKRFSPKSKKYKLKTGETEINYLFATDILSEGQNLQDSGMLINYDLHWNPVRMIQRNGRVNRLGSEYSEVLISNMTPEDHIDLYLNLVTRLENKINTIKNSIGIDQGVLSDDDVNPIEYIDDAKRLYGSDSGEATATLNKYEDDDDFLSWTNDHVFVLREYLANATEKEIAWVRNMPAGKWNYLPHKSGCGSDTIIGLQKVDGRMSLTNAPISQTFFTNTTNSEHYPTVIMDDFEALGYIKTTPSDNARVGDKIDVDRGRVVRRSRAQAEVAAATDSAAYKISGKKIDAVSAIAKIFTDVDLQPLIEKNIRHRYHKQEFEQLCRQINSDIKDSGAIKQTTIKRFGRLIEELKEVESEEVVVDDVKSVLYYIKK